MDDLIDQLLEVDAKAADEAGNAARQASAACQASTQPDDTSELAPQREKLVTIAAGEQAKQYLGKNWTVEDIDSLSEEEVAKLYARYEARLGAAMTKTLGRAALQLYTTVASMILPIPPENHEFLLTDLESDPFVGHALTSASCDLYHR
ncbi:hypothetical protein ElyMa_001795100 [Elysia marginata]|uniref:Uncharacterized protein n=1 Tax=Elysia marginata TaxID=1093978 RepID=A0AAV4EF98_9GAST|nr:hypothetical protein ElyMa_001795100 [Elysia marginata]